MILLIVFAFLAGIVTILSPCILPILPIVLSSSVDSSGLRRPFGVVTGFVLSFTFFTLFLSTLVRISGIPAESLRYISIAILILFGLSLIIPQVQLTMEKMFSRLTKFAPKGKSKQGFIGGLVIGLSLGLLWTPCVGPILASVISLALSGTVTAQAIMITLAYSLGTAIPMFVIMLAGATALRKASWFLKNSGTIQKAFGILMIVTAVGIFFNVDRTFQSYIITTFPEYGVGLTKFEENTAVKKELERINKNPMDFEIGKPMSDIPLPKGPVAPELIVGGAWLNSKPLTLSELRGKVVVVDFWTYTCINCQRTLPYLKKWYKTYEDDGLVIIGVHSPEFAFEKSEKNVAKAIEDFEIPYPVMQDNDFETWRAYNNRYWPAKYIIDKDGFIRYTHFGEGAYDESEQVIRELLKEAGVVETKKSVDNPEYKIYANTLEKYLGYGRIDSFASSEEIVKDELSTYSIPNIIPDDQVAYGGHWNVMEEYANPQSGATLLLNFDSKEVFLVMRTKGAPAKIKVYIDDKLQHFGDDSMNGVVTVDTDKLYKIIKLPAPGRHMLRIEFEDSNAELYAFTFG